MRQRVEPANNRVVGFCSTMLDALAQVVYLRLRSFVETYNRVYKVASRTSPGAKMPAGSTRRLPSAALVCGNSLPHVHGNFVHKPRRELGAASCRRLPSAALVRRDLQSRVQDGFENKPERENVCGFNPPLAFGCARSLKLTTARTRCL